LVGFAVTWLALLAAFQTDIPSTFVGFAIVFVGLVATPALAIVHAAVTAWRNPFVARQPFHRWYVYPAYAVAFSLLMLADESEFRKVFGGYEPYRMMSVPMEPTLKRGDYVMVKTASAADSDMKAHLGHVVAYVLDGSTYMHRMTAVGGDRIAMQAGQVVVNDRALPRQALCMTPLSDGNAEAKLSVETHGARAYVVQNSTKEGAEYDPFTSERDEEVLEPDQFFVIGDSRDYSHDSRISGPLRNEQFVGRALYIFWSDDWSRIGRSLAPDAPVVRADYCSPEPKP
jgi:signal peptidase I